MAVARQLLQQLKPVRLGLALLSPLMSVSSTAGERAFEPASWPTVTSSYAQQVGVAAPLSCMLAWAVRPFGIAWLAALQTACVTLHCIMCFVCYVQGHVPA